MNPKNISIQSDALKANLLETRVEAIVIDPAYQILLEVVQDFQGISKSLESLLYEISHPFRNWVMLVPKLRAFVLKNHARYLGHPRGPEAFDAFAGIFFEAIEEAKIVSPGNLPASGGARRDVETLLPLAMESLLAYVEKLVFALHGGMLADYGAVLAGCLKRLYELDDDRLMHMVQGHHQLQKMARFLLDCGASGKYPADSPPFDYQPLYELVRKNLSLNYHYWLKEDDPLPWFSKNCGAMCEGWEAGRLFYAISHERLQDHLATVEEAMRSMQEGKADAGALLEILLSLPNHIDIVRLYKDVPGRLLEGDGSPDDQGGDRFSENRKLLFLFRIMDTAGLSLIHEETLREINRSLVNLIRVQTFEEIESFLVTTLHVLKDNVRRYPHTSLQCIQILGTEVFARESSRLVETFLWETVRFGFQYANIRGVDEDWQPITNPSHLINIRVWLALIMQEPKWCATLFSALIINLKLSGTCVKDTDLFQRDITGLLNHPIEPVYNLAKQFAKLMPVFFNEIGAEGELREVSTEMDEIHRRQDRLIHFLRKQSHVESSNLIVDFIRDIFQFFHTGDKQILVSHLPPEVLQEVPVSGTFFDDLHRLMNRLFDQAIIFQVDDLLLVDDQQLKTFVAAQTDIAGEEGRRFMLLVNMFNLVHLKYDLSYKRLRHQLVLAVDRGFPEMEELLADLEICDPMQCLAALLSHLELLKNTILSDNIYEAREDIYHKRHIAVDIPSVYGCYREKKFDALGLTFRLESLANTYLENLPQTVNLTFITRVTFIRIVECLNLYLRALKIDGITSRRLETYVSLLTSSLHIRRVSFTQYLDIFRGLSEGVKDVIYAYYTNIHQNNLSIIIPQIGSNNLMPKYTRLWDFSELEGSVHRLSESFMRDLIAGTFGLQHLDNFIIRILQTLEGQKEVLDEKSLDLLMTYNPDAAISLIRSPNSETNNLIHLGNKGYNLTLLASDSKPVPPGFIITTEVFRCWPVIKSFFKARDEFMQQLRHAMTDIEGQMNRRYGDPGNPLLFSVRSGAAISMPGMMATIHNVGLNEDIVREFVEETGMGYFAWDNYRRFLQSWAMAKGMKRDSFQALMDRAKVKHGVTVKRQFTPEQMEELTLEYQKTIRGVGIGIPDDPWLQLVGAVEIVLDSWRAEKTREYRSLMDISESWGTAVIAQAMVFGNLGPQSGSGVLFTAHPYRKVRRVALWGDYAPADQGEDIVSGLVTAFPVSVEQAEIDGRSPENTLERKFPEIYAGLLEMARDLVYEKGWNPQEFEFTFESPAAKDLYLLQTRDMITIKKKESFDSFVDSDTMHNAVLGKGIGVSGSALAGRAVFTVENILRLRRENPSAKLILIRQDTVPEDIKEISLADALLTARGGQTSHASVVALRLEKTCVVGCSGLSVYESEERCQIGEHIIRFGDAISIDGRKGLILKGKHPTQCEMRILPI